MKRIKIPQLKETQQTQMLAIGVVLFILAMALIFGSCSVQNDLMVHNPNDLKVIWCDYDIVYCVDGNGKLVELKNVDHQAFFVDDYIICKY